LRLSLHVKADESPGPSQTILLMIAGNKQFSYALLNHLSKEVFEFGHYTSEGFKDEEWADFFEQNKIFTERYHQTAIAFNVTESILVPSEFYKAEDTRLQLNAVYGNDVESNLITEFLPDWSIYNVYRLQESLHTAISRRFVTGKFWNINSVWLKSFSEKKQNSILIDFSTDDFSVIVFKDDLLQLAQTFAYSSPEDVLYYLLKICRQLDLTQKEVKIILSGLIEKDSSIYRELYKYFIRLEFESIPSEIRLAEALNEYPDHYFSSICKLATCVL
jgi:hypothetical protein